MNKILYNTRSILIVASEGNSRYWIQGSCIMTLRIKTGVPIVYSNSPQNLP